MLDLGKVEEVAAAVGEREAAVAVEEDQEKGEEETDNWDWEEEYLQFLCFPIFYYNREEDNIGSCVEDNIGEHILGDWDEARLSGDQRQREEGKEEAKDWDQDGDAIQDGEEFYPSNNWHATIDDNTKY